MLVIPIKPLANQDLTTTLDGQVCQISIVQKSTGLFLSLALNSAAIVSSALALDAVKMVRGTYQGFVGDLAFFDKMGTDAPYYTGLGTRWILVYLEADDLT